MVIMKVTAAQAEQGNIEFLIQFFLTRPLVTDATVYDLLQIFQSGPG